MGGGDVAPPKMEPLSRYLPPSRCASGFIGVLKNFHRGFVSKMLPAKFVGVVKIRSIYGLCRN